LVSKRKSRDKTPGQQTNTTPTASNTAPVMAIYKMLPSPHDCWGIRVEGGRPTVGQVITVAKRDGTTKQETVSGIISTRGGVTLCTIAPKPRAARSTQQGRRGGIWDSQKFNGYGAKRGGWRKRCVTDGNCSNFGDGRSCGGYDCDGW